MCASFIRCSCEAPAPAHNHSHAQPLPSESQSRFTPRWLTITVAHSPFHPSLPSKPGKGRPSPGKKRPAALTFLSLVRQGPLKGWGEGRVRSFHSGWVGGSWGSAGCVLRLGFGGWVCWGACWAAQGCAGGGAGADLLRGAGGGRVYGLCGGRDRRGRGALGRGCRQKM